MKKSPLGPLRFLASLKLGVLILLGLVGSLATGTILESAYDTPSAQYYVYRALWFKALLILLGINIAAVMADRWPWKKRHIPFLTAHIGILTLLFGSWLTDRHGLDGMMRVSEGESTASVEIDAPILVASDGGKVYSIPIQWLPPGVGFKPFSVRSRGIPFDVTVDRFLSHAEAVQDFLPEEVPPESPEKSTPAIRVRLEGGPMRIRQDFWIWGGSSEWSSVQAGPAWMGFAGKAKQMPTAGPRLLLDSAPDGGISFTAYGSSGESAKGRLPAGKIESEKIPVPWKGGVNLTVLRWIPHARLQADYKVSRIQYRDMAPPSAIHLAAGASGVWLGQGERAVLDIGNSKVEFGYFRKRVLMPYALRLDRFQIDHYEGTMRPMSYSSKVTVLDGRRPEADQKQVLISMNEPLEHEGVTFYQASYEEAMPRPVTSIFSVNRDPGRPFKYAGSLLIVLGAILLFAMKYRKKGASS